MQHELEEKRNPNKPLDPELLWKAVQQCPREFIPGK